MDTHEEKKGWRPGELRKSPLGGSLLWLARVPLLRKACLKAALHLEGSDFHSETARRILERYYGVQVGAYTYGSCLDPVMVLRDVTIGRYSSIGAGVRIWQRHHPIDWLSQHPIFFNAAVGYVKEDLISMPPVEIGNDAWVGNNVIVLPGCKRIGDGAVIGAGTILTKDVPDFAIVTGVPGRIMRYRFPEEVRERIKASAWWDLPVEKVVEHLEDMQHPLGDHPENHPLLRLDATVGGE